MKKINNAFTLIELVVGITISMLLMVSVGIFVNNGMANILTQQKVIENTTNITDFTSNIHTAINLMQSGSIFPKIITNTSTGIIFKRGQNLGEGGFSYIGTIQSTIDSNGDGIYCNSGSEILNTKHIILKNFIPYEEKNEDIFDDSKGGYTGTLISHIGGYKAYQKQHTVKYLNNIIIGKGIFGNNFTNGSNGTDIYLNSPTGLTMIGTNILLVSDTLNNRILSYNISTKKINILLNEDNGLNEPTGLYYNNSEKALYISNSGKGEILKYSSKKINTAPDLKLTGFSENNINKIEIKFTGNILPNLNTTGNWNITNPYSDSYKKYINNTILYYSIKKLINETKNQCDGKSNGDYIFDSTETTKPIIYCTKSGSGQSLTYPKKNISNIEISNLSNFTSTGSYIVNLKLFNDSTEINLGYFPYFTQSDDNILTPEDNILETIKSGLNYPTGLWWDSGIKYNEFGKSGRTFKNLKLHKTDTILTSPIKNLKIYNNNEAITINLKYFKRFNCYNKDDNSKRTYLFKKNLK